jgi:hypothetical protein
MLEVFRRVVCNVFLIWPVKQNFLKKKKRAAKTIFLKTQNLGEVLSMAS